ncbi:BZ3501_MvSof-1269-A2-R1_C30g00071 [Microbotryum saponariae]|nr:BZ3501_MvSof-1269-A2-R1_C68g00383 [Microbotryum saponariae]SDA08542.1 BZ3501_MvSof-1269-A2-R1_C30g00071 [Microbotryum saponariae]
MPIPSGPWEQVAIDFMTGLPPVELEGMMVAQIMVVTDTWGKMVHLIPLPADADSELVAEKYYATVFRLHGMPSAIVSDRDPKFTSQFWRALQAKIGTVLRMSTAAHPETDGSSENRIKMVTQTLRIMVSSNHEAWASRLVEAEFALNSSVAVSTSLSAFEATYGYLPRCWPSDSWSGRQRPLQKTLTTRGGGDQAEGRSTGRGQATEGQPRRGRGCEARSKSSISDFIANEIENEG